MMKVILLTVLAVSAAGAHAAGDAVTLKGDFTWGKPKKGKPAKGDKVSAVFTAKEAGKYDVVFTAKWKKKDQVFKGTAEGSLDNGKLTGKATYKDGRTWTFKCDVKDGQATGTHYAFKKGTESKRSNGTLTISK